MRDEFRFGPGVDALCSFELPVKGDELLRAHAARRERPTPTGSRDSRSDRHAGMIGLLNRDNEPIVGLFGPTALRVNGTAPPGTRAQVRLAVQAADVIELVTEEDGEAVPFDAVNLSFELALDESPRRARLAFGRVLRLPPDTLARSRLWLPDVATVDIDISP